MDASNRFGNSTQTFEFNHYAHVIPAPARKLTFLGTTPHSIYIEWSIGIFKNFKKGLAYRVSYAWYLANDWNEEEGKFNSEDAIISQIPCRNLTTHPCWNVRHYSSKDVETYEDTVGVNVTNLKYPNVVYDFRIEMKSAIAGDELWSDPAYMYAKTDPCAPYLSPEIDVGGFQIDNQRLDRQDVLVFWKDISPEEKNGNEFQYKITMLENDVESTTAPDLVTNSFAKYVNLSINESYRFFIKSTNAFGSAPYSAELRLPQKDDILPEVVSLNKVYFENGTYELSWSPPSSIYDRITNFTIFWCQSNQEYPSPCSGSLDWTHLTADTCRQNFTLDSTVGYHFAISANSLNSTSGMTWALCTIIHDKLQKIKPVWVTTVGSYFIHLQWKLECLERAVDIKGFNITYCPVDEIDLEHCVQPKETLLVYGDAKTEQANVTDLNPFTHYKITVSIFTNNSLGPPSDDVSTCTLEAAPNMVDVQVEIFDITNSSAVIQWNTPTTLNGLLNRYEVFYNNEKMITNNTIAKLLGLSSYKTYEIRIAACTSLCSHTAPMNFQTSIGTPGEVTKIWVENTTNSTHTKLKWIPPEVLGGPHPIYDVHTQIIQLHENLTIDEFETTGTEADVKISCELESSHSDYTFFVRAKNIDHVDTAEIKQYFGPWSMAYSIDCINYSSMQTIWKVLIGSLFGVLLLLLVPFLCKKAYLKFQQMKQVQVILPIAFHLDVRIEVKHTDCCNDDGKSWKDDNEIDLVSKDTDLDQHSIDEVDFKLLSDKEKAKESKEKCSLS
ncbi:Fibronectin type 3 domain [Sarracenia purpurea var. burkii]